MPAGKVGGAPAPEDQQFTFTIQLQGRLTSEDEFRDLVIKTTDDGGLIRLRDVGEVELGGNSYEISALNLEGNPTVSMFISQLGGSNALVVSDGVKQVIQEFKEKMPVGMKIEQVFDSTEFITASIEGVVGSLRDAVVLVVLILFLFLQNWKATLVPGIAIPVALVGLSLIHI